MSAAENGLSSYAELAQVITDLPVIVRSARRMRRLSLRGAAEQIGLGFTTVQRVEAGHDMDTGTLVALLRWLDDPMLAEPEDAANG
jgi:transcriptional regulator with XRE-family HTH domain